jgi:hypothetical protein
VAGEDRQRRAAATCSIWSIAAICSVRARAKSAIAISDGLVEAAFLRLIVSSGTTRSMVSGKTAFTSPTCSVPSRQVIVRLPAAASARSSASAADTVTGGLDPPGWNERVGRISFLPSTPFTLIDIWDAL